MGLDVRRVWCRSAPDARRGPGAGLLQGARSMERKLIRLWLVVLCASCAVESDGRAGVPCRSWHGVLRGRGGGGGGGEDDASARPSRQERECAPGGGATEWGSLPLQLERAKSSHIIGHSVRGGGGESSELRRFPSAPLLDPRQTPERGRRGVASRPNHHQPPSLPPPLTPRRPWTGLVGIYLRTSGMPRELGREGAPQHSVNPTTKRCIIRAWGPVGGV